MIETTLIIEKVLAIIFPKRVRRRRRGVDVKELANFLPPLRLDHFQHSATLSHRQIEAVKIKRLLHHLW